MRINRKSWHYRFMKFMNNPFYYGYNFTEPRSLCQYFWGLIFSIFIMIPASIALSPLFILIFGVDKLCKKFGFWQEPRKYEKKKEPWLIVSYFRAVKNKVCPIIEYHEE